MDASPPQYGLTKDDLAALKTATYCVLSRRPERDADNRETGGPMEDVLRLGRDVRFADHDSVRQLNRMSKLVEAGLWKQDPDAYGVRYTREIRLASGFCSVTRYRQNDFGVDYAGDNVKCSWIESMLRSDHSTVSVFHLLRVGDSIASRWVGTNNSTNTTAVGYVRDEVYLRIIRGGKPTAEFLLDVYVGPPNTARFVGGY